MEVGISIVRHQVFDSAAHEMLGSHTSDSTTCYSDRGSVVHMFAKLGPCELSKRHLTNREMPYKTVYHKSTNNCNWNELFM